MNRARILSDLGLAFRAGAVVSGEEFSLIEIKRGKAKMVFLANDAGVNTTKRITDKSTFYKVDLILDFTSEELSSAIGKNNRKVIAVVHTRFAKLIKSALEE